MLGISRFRYYANLDGNPNLDDLSSVRTNEFDIICDTEDAMPNAYALVSFHAEAASDKQQAARILYSIASLMNAVLKIKGSYLRIEIERFHIEDERGRYSGSITFDQTNFEGSPEYYNPFLSERTHHDGNQCIDHMLTKSKTDDELRKILRLFGRNQGWGDLFSTYEILKNVAKEKCPYTSSQVRRFTATANNPLVSGDDSRHGVATKAASQQPMTFDEGRQFIKEYILAAYG